MHHARPQLIRTSGTRARRRWTPLWLVRPPGRQCGKTRRHGRAGPDLGTGARAHSRTTARERRHRYARAGRDGRRAASHLFIGLPIGHQQTLSKPSVVARMIELALAGRVPERVLEIGTDCGYQAAILSYLTRDDLFDRAREAAVRTRETKSPAVARVEHPAALRRRPPGRRAERPAAGSDAGQTRRADAMARIAA